MNYIIDIENSDIRLDKAISNLTGKSRNNALILLESDLVTVNDKKAKPSYKTVIGDKIEILEQEVKVMELKPEKLDLDIVYQDNDVVVINKAKGMVVHPAVGNYEGTLVSGLLYEVEDLSSINGTVRPGIVHRIDKDTTGLLMVAKNDFAHEHLSLQLRNHTVKRCYIALVYGVISEDRGRIDAPIGRDSQTDRKRMAVVEGGKNAVTNFKVLERFKDYTLIECELETGRTHQIRVHMKYIGHPLVGDPLYGPRKIIGDCGQYLHAKTLGFKHPTKDEYLEFDSKLPDYFLNFIEELRKST